MKQGLRIFLDKMTTLNNGQKALQTGLSQLNDGASQLASGASQLQEGQTKLSEGLVTFDGKLSEATAGGQKLADGSLNLADGVSQLQTGATALADGSNQLANGSNQMTDGTSKLVKGSTEFKDQVNEAAKQSSDIQADDKTYNMVAAPVTAERDSLNKVPNYGTGIAPYFLSLGLFVGALISSIVFPFRDPVGIPKNAFSWFVSKWSIISVIGILQALIASFIIIKSSSYAGTKCSIVCFIYYFDKCILYGTYSVIGYYIRKSRSIYCDYHFNFSISDKCRNVSN